MLSGSETKTFFLTFKNVNTQTVNSLILNDQKGGTLILHIPHFRSDLKGHYFVNLSLTVHVDTQFHNMLGCQHVIGLQYFTHESTMDPW